MLPLCSLVPALALLLALCPTTIGLNLAPIPEESPSPNSFSESAKWKPTTFITVPIRMPENPTSSAQFTNLPPIATTTPCPSSTIVSPWSPPRPLSTSSSLAASAPTSSTTLTALSTTSSQATSTTLVTVWTVQSGDTGWAIASEAHVPFFAISSANPTVSWTALTIGQLLVIPPSPTAPAQVTGQIADKAFITSEGMMIPQVMYKQFGGDGSTASGWPDMADWLSFDSAWNNIKNDLGRNCGDGITSNSNAETKSIRNAILSVAANSQLDPRFILAVLVQERNGCVRVCSSSVANSKSTLSRPYNDNWDSNHNGTTDNPCSALRIDQVMSDAASAPIEGMTLVSALNQAAGMPNVEPAQAYYRVARIYVSGPYSLSPTSNGDLGSVELATSRCYASDIANRLLGWSNGKIGRNPCSF